MIVFKYRKSGGACFISHIDLLRHVARILRRAKIKVNFSQGFNPHELVYFSPPLVVGVNSECEYLTIDTNMDKDEAFKRYNDAVPKELEVLEAFKSVKNPNLQANIVAADYVFDIPYQEINLGDNFIINYKKKGEDKTEDVIDRIYGIFNHNGRLALRLQAGNASLRPDRILSELNRRCNSNCALVDVVKIAQYVMIDNEYIDVDSFLAN